MHNSIKIGVIIPDRGDRPKFLENCLRMIRNQTMQPDQIVVVDDPPKNERCDITWRYRTGYDRLRNKGLSCILFIENDDFYHPQYIEIMISQWQRYGYPDLFGTAYTIYYHIKVFKYFTMNHPRRASAMNTLIKPDLDFPWCIDEEPYTDLHLWSKLWYRERLLTGAVFKPDNHIAIGIKHGEGLTGGRNHTDHMHRFINDDTSHAFLREHMDPESFKFYTEYYAIQS